MNSLRRHLWPNDDPFVLGVYVGYVIIILWALSGAPGLSGGL